MVGPTPQHWANREELEMQYTTRINAMSISSLLRSIGRNLSLPLLTCPSMIGPGRARFHIPFAGRGRFIRTIRNTPAVTRFGQMRPDLGFWAPLPQQQYPPSTEVVSWLDSHRAVCDQRQSRPRYFPGAALPSVWHRCARSAGCSGASLFDRAIESVRGRVAAAEAMRRWQRSGATEQVQ